MYFLSAKLQSLRGTRKQDWYPFPLPVRANISKDRNVHFPEFSWFIAKPHPVNHWTTFFIAQHICRIRSRWPLQTLMIISIQQIQRCTITFYDRQHLSAVQGILGSLHQRMTSSMFIFSDPSTILYFMPIALPFPYFIISLSVSYSAPQNGSFIPSTALSLFWIALIVMLIIQSFHSNIVFQQP